MRAAVQLSLDPLAINHSRVHVEASVTSEVEDLNVTGKSINDVTIRVGRSGGSQSIELRRASGEDVNVTLRQLGQALIMHADVLEKVTIGASEDEKAAIASIKRAQP